MANMMKLDLNDNPDSYRIRAYAKGRITVNDEVLESSFIVMPDRLQRDWPPQQFSELRREHFDILAGLNPDIVLLGTGKILSFPAPELTVTLMECDIGLEVMTTDAACRTYDILLREERKVAAALLML
jgi:uncharacterized protein